LHQCRALPTYQRLVKTTPKPKATKKRRGELEFPPPPPPPLPLELEEVADGAEDVVVDEDIVVELGCQEGEEQDRNAEVWLTAAADTGSGVAKVWGATRSGTRGDGLCG
jgi:hypothetical protein